jgi:hypothetical protein
VGEVNWEGREKGQEKEVRGELGWESGKKGVDGRKEKGEGGEGEGVRCPITEGQREVKTQGKLEGKGKGGGASGK